VSRPAQSGGNIDLAALAELLVSEANTLALLAVDERDPQRREWLCLSSGRLHGAAVVVERAR
jgi:hypothetical protein